MAMMAFVLCVSVAVRLATTAPVVSLVSRAVDRRHSFTIMRKAIATAVAILVLALFAARVDATIGGDISGGYGTDTFKCTRDKGWDFVITRSYCSFGGVDPGAIGNLDSAKAAGIPYRDVYHFPCRGKNAQAQVKEDVDHVGKDRFGTLWFDIETNPSPGCGWSSDKGSNCQFMRDLIDGGHAVGVRMGVYASEYMWGSIMGDCDAAKDLPLWYAHYDGKQTFSDFTAFGGWSKPAMKQYWDSVGYCGINSDADWYP